MYILFIERQKKESAQKFCSKDLVQKKTFRLSSRAPLVLYWIKNTFYIKKYLTAVHFSIINKTLYSCIKVVLEFKTL